MEIRLDGFTKVILVLIFLVLLANLLKGINLTQPALAKGNGGAVSNVALAADVFKIAGADPIDRVYFYDGEHLRFSNNLGVSWTLVNPRKE